MHETDSFLFPGYRQTLPAPGYVPEVKAISLRDDAVCQKLKGEQHDRRCFDLSDADILSASEKDFKERAFSLSG